jgi:glycosyltransferase involved in cell wall biosynthesis
VAFAKGDCRNNLFSATATNKIFEYMMMGLPVIAPDYKSYQDLVEKENIGICVDAESPQLIADGITKMISDSTRMKLMKENSLRLSRERYNWDNVFPALLTEYQRLMN